MTYDSDFDENDEIGPFDFMKLPYDIRLMVVKEMDLPSFVHLKKSSKSTLELCENCGFVPDFCVDDMDYNDREIGFIVDGPLHSDALVHLHQIPMRCRMVLGNFQITDLSPADFDLFRGREVAIRRLELTGTIKCNPLELNAYLEKHRVSLLFIDNDNRTDSSDIDFYTQPAVKRLSSLTVMSETEPLPTAILLGLSAPSIEFSSLYCDALRPILDEWTEGVRVIERVHFYSPPNEGMGGQGMFSLLSYILLDDLEAEHYMVRFSEDDLELEAIVTRADGQRLRVMVEVNDAWFSVKFLGSYMFHFS